MAAVVEEKQKRRGPYKTVRWWAEQDEKISKRFPIGITVKVHRGRGYQQVRILGPSRRGKMAVYNPVSGKQYYASADIMIPPDAKSAAVMQATLDQERATARTRSTVVSMYLKPLMDADRRSDEPTTRDKAQLLPLSTDEIISYTALNAIIKTLGRVGSNRDSFRNPDHHALLTSSRILLQTIINEMETYRELPAEA